MGHMMRAHAIMPMWNPGIGLKKASRGEVGLNELAGAPRMKRRQRVFYC